MARKRKKSFAGTLPAGSRVGIVSHADEQKVHLYGYGQYMGLEAPPDDVEAPIHLIRFFGPHKIVLDDRRVLWGFQGWWAPEEDVKNWIGEREVVIV